MTSHGSWLQKGSNWNGAAGAAPFSLLDLESRDAISIPTAPTKTTSRAIVQVAFFLSLGYNVGTFLHLRTPHGYYQTIQPRV